MSASEFTPNRCRKLCDGISVSGIFLPRLGIKTDKTSFGHNFVDAARNSRIPDEIVQALKGDTRSCALALGGEMKELRFKELGRGYFSL